MPPSLSTNPLKSPFVNLVFCYRKGICALAFPVFALRQSDLLKSRACASALKPLDHLEV